MIVIKSQHNSRQTDWQTVRGGRTEGRRLRPCPARSMHSQSKSIALIRLGWRIPACLPKVGRRRRNRDASHNENESGQGVRIVYVDGLLLDYTYTLHICLLYTLGPAPLSSIPLLVHLHFDLKPLLRHATWHSIVARPSVTMKPADCQTSVYSICILYACYIYGICTDIPSEFT